MTEIPIWYTDFIAEVVGALPRDIDEETARGWLDNVEGLRDALQVLVSSTALPGIKNDKASDGSDWELIKDSVEPETIEPTSVVMEDFPPGTEDMIGEPIVELISGMDGLLGQRHAEFLVDHPAGIPEEYQRYSLVFPGTIWRSPDGNHQVPCITCRQGSWELIFGILEGGFDSRDKLALVGA